MLSVLSYSLAAFTTGVLCLLVIKTKDRHIHLTGDTGRGGPQKLHTDVVPRVGGVAVIIGILVGGALLSTQESSGMWKVALVLMPCFMAGLLEDITKRVTPAQRYIATAISAGLFCWVCNVWITSVGLPWVDLLFEYTVFAVLFTVFAIGSIAHAFNLIDGQNGLCSGTSIIACLCISTVSYDVGAYNTMWLSGLCAAANIGFLVYNYPFGRIFLGDAGAYVNGALIGILLVWLTSTHDSVSPWFALAVLIYPVWETFFSMARRMHSGQSISEPDSEHLHSLMFKNARRTESFLSKSSAPKIWVGYAISCWLSLAFYKSTGAQMLICLCFIILYLFAYSAVKRTRQSQISSSNNH